MAPKTRKNHLLFVVLGLLLVIGAAYWALRPSGPPLQCEVLPASQESEIARRGDELLELLKADPSQFMTQTTEGFREQSTSEDLKPLAAHPSLAATRRLEHIWHVKNRSGSQALVLCNVIAPYADAVGVPAEAEEAALLFYEVDGAPLATRIFVLLTREDDPWRAQFVFVEPYRHRGRSADFFEGIGDARMREGRDIEAAIAYMAAEKLSTPPKGVDLIAHNRIKEKVKTTGGAENTKWFLSQERVPREHEFLSVAMEVSEKDGLLPRIIFVSAKPDEEMREEARALLAAVVKVAPSLREDFAAVLMSALREPPASRVGPHTTRDTVLRLDGK